MSSPAVPQGDEKSRVRRAAFASFIGTSIEWYDFFIYGTAAALIFPKLFFPKFSSLAGTLASFATFGVGFVARPIGGIVFGHFGDRIGRKSMLVVTLLLMGVATFVVGLLPTFNTLGLLAPTLLVLLRFVQGLAVGGEWGGATLMAVEHAPKETRNFYASWPQLGVPAGLILSAIVFASFSSPSFDWFLIWGWRIPFLLSALLIVVGLFIRMSVVESPAFERVKALGAESKLPLLELLRHYRPACILATGLQLISSTGFYLVTTFTLSYVTDRLRLPSNVPLIGLLLAGTVQFVGILIFGRVADRIGAHVVAIYSAGFLVLLAYPLFWLVDTGHSGLIWLAMVLATAGGGALYAVTGVLMAELFDARVRYSGISFGYQMAWLIGGAPAPLIATALVHWAHGSSWPVASYYAISALISFAAVCLVSKAPKVEMIADIVRAEAVP